MMVSPRQIASSALLVMVVGAPVVGLGLGWDAAVGFAVTGLAMLANLALWVVVVRAAVRSTLRGAGAGWAPLFWILKVLALVATMFVLVSQFPALPVLLGSSVVVAALMGTAVVGLGAELQVEEGRF